MTPSDHFWLYCHNFAHFLVPLSEAWIVSFSEENQPSLFPLFLHTNQNYPSQKSFQKPFFSSICSRPSNGKFSWRGLEKLEVVYCVGKVAKGRRWGWSGVVGSPGGEGWSGLDLLNTKQYTAKRNSAHTGSNVQKYGVIIKLPKSTVSSYETNIFLPAVIRKKKKLLSPNIW